MKSLVSIFLLAGFFANAQILNHKKEFTRQDSLRGTNNEFRNWWDVLHYDIEIEPDFEKQFIHGKNTIAFNVLSEKGGDRMQIDLQEPMQMDAVYLDGSLINPENI